MQAHSHTLESFRDALKVFLADVYNGEPEALEIADIITHYADMGDDSAKQLCELMQDICVNEPFFDLQGNRINIGACCSACAQGKPCTG